MQCSLRGNHVWRGPAHMKWPMMHIHVHTLCAYMFAACKCNHTHTYTKERGILLQYNLSLVMNSHRCLLRHPAHADKPTHFSLSVQHFFFSFSFLPLFPSYSTELIFALLSLAFPPWAGKNLHSPKMWLTAAWITLVIKHKFNALGLTVAAHTALCFIFSAGASRVGFACLAMLIVHTSWHIS